MFKHVEFSLDVENPYCYNEQLASALAAIGDVRETDGAAAWIADKSGDPTHYVEFQIVPEDEFYIYAREQARDNNNPIPTDQMIQYDIDNNYHTITINSVLHVLVPQP